MEVNPSLMEVIGENQNFKHVRECFQKLANSLNAMDMSIFIIIEGLEWRELSDRVDGQGLSGEILRRFLS